MADKVKKDYRLKIFLGITAVLLLTAVVAITALATKELNQQTAHGTSKLVLETKSFALGDISMADGLVRKKIKISNAGDGVLKISKMFTSCMCTKVRLTVAGKQGPIFGMLGHGNGPLLWSEELEPGESGELEIIFDPNAHGPNATGPITRTVTLLSNDGGQEGAKSVITFTGNVIK